MSQPSKIRFHHKIKLGRLIIKSKPKPQNKQGQKAGQIEEAEQKAERSIQRLEERIDLEETARYSGALIRRRVVKSASDLLRFILVYSLCDFSLREVGMWGTMMGLGSLSKTAILKRIRKCRVWLGILIVSFLRLQRIEIPNYAGVRLRMIDASTISEPGSMKTDWRLHLSFDLGSACVDDVLLTDSRSGETLVRFEFQPGDICLADRAYGVARSIGVLLGASAWFVIRIGWRNLPLQMRDGQPFVISDWLRVQSADPAAHPAQTKVWVNTPQGRYPIRLIARAIPAEKAELARKRMLAEAKKKKRKVNENSL
jgi:hypothetical protein